MPRPAAGPLYSEAASNCKSIDSGRLTEKQREVLLGMAVDGTALPIGEIRRRFHLKLWKGTVHPLVRRAYLKKTPFTDVYQITSRGRTRAIEELRNA